ncbi:deoR-like helix-turn-helix domain protein [Staphylococcus aureus]|nr:deoR-like helix-turn-helix domain protein [Staphylococcus aureus]SUK93483.1 deoR-like helix-turn-helix domain protein [Staphylococcus aureus]SUL05065.1 deoR-like helix-turn-helix domain protein [Staphylococcus aureus]SUL06825.1 deoR-like helix-turn-helix domain protein [Staphylococcus aureus]SUL82961.1 deoR-like helix-turn-helix domain protein [Staphylococcus aureus]
MLAKLDNLLAILWMLSSDKKVTAKQISDKLEMNIRTVYRYMDTLSKSGVPIISDTGHNGGYTLLNDFIEAPLFFNSEEQIALCHAANFAEEAGYYGGKSLNSAITKLRNYSNLDQEIEIEKHTSSLEVIMRNSTFPLRSHLEVLEYCVADRNSVIISYRKGGEDISQDRQVDPYRIIYWKNKWYLVAYCQLREDVRTFRVDRIDSLILTDETFEQLEDFSVDNYFMGDLLPIMGNEGETTRLVIRGDVSTLDDVCQHWFLGHYIKNRAYNQAEFQLEEEIIHKYVPQILLPYGKGVQVVAPLSLKEEIVNNLSDLIAFYQK